MSQPRPTIAVTGYASLDHVMSVDGIPQPGRTTTILSRPADAWPRLGGSPAYVAMAAAAGGVSVHPVSWIGDDGAGADYSALLGKGGVAVDGLAILPGQRTPIALLAYEPEGGCLCLYHPAPASTLTLTPEQEGVLRLADWLCVTVGPAQATSEALALMKPDAKLCWVVKDDPRAVPPDLAARLAARSDLICCSTAERAFVECASAGVAPRTGRLLIETRGGQGAAADRDGETIVVPAEPLTVSDPTGAGDTFAGGVLAAMASGQNGVAAIVEAGHRAARALLTARRKTLNESA